eukprot:825741_1
MAIDSSETEDKRQWMWMIRRTIQRRAEMHLTDEIKITLMPLRDARNGRKFYPETYVFLQLLIALELYDRGEYSLFVDVLFRLIGFCKESKRITNNNISDDKL